MITIFVIFALAPLAISNTVGYLQTRDALTAQAFRNLKNVAARSAVELENVLASWRRSLGAFEHPSTTLVGALRQDPPAALAAIQAHLPGPRATPADELLLLDPAGRVVASTLAARAVGTDLSATPCSMGDGAIMTLDTGGDAAAFAVAERMVGADGSVLGTICRRISVAEHRTDLMPQANAPGEVVALLDESGRVIGATGTGEPVVPGGHWYMASSWESSTHLADGSPALSAYAPVVALRVGIVAITPVSHVLADLDDLRRRVIVLTAVLALLVGAAVWGTVRSFTQPLSDVVDAARQTADGTRGASVEISGPVEIVELGSAFNRMSVALKDSHDELEERIAARTAELERSRAFVDLLLDSIDEMVIVVDDSYKVIKMNQPAAKLLGADAVGRQCREVCSEPDTVCDHCLLKKTFATGHRTRQERSLRVGASQEIVVMEASPIRDAMGDIEAVVEIGRVVTTERRLQAQMVHQEKMATFGLLAAGIAHEIGNPLASIQSQLRMTRSDPSRSGATLEIVDREVARITTLLRELVGFIRRRRDGVSLVSLNQVIEDVAQLVSHDPRRRDVKIEKRLSADSCAVRGKIDEILQVVLNLSLNGLDAMPDGGTLTLETAVEDGHPVVRVRDTGGGVTPEAHERLFEPFFTTKPPGRGTGLGLFVSHGIVEALGGQIVLESSSAGGAVFAVRLPVVPQMEVAA